MISHPASHVYYTQVFWKNFENFYGQKKWVNRIFLSHYSVIHLRYPLAEVLWDGDLPMKKRWKRTLRGVFNQKKRWKYTLQQWFYRYKTYENILKFNFSCPSLDMLTVHASTLKQSFIVAFYIRTSKQVLRGYFEAVICWWKSDQKLVIFTPDY